MISRRFLRHLTLSSFLPLASCATPAESPEGSHAGPAGSNSVNAPINSGNINESNNSALESDELDNANGNLIGEEDEEEDDGSMDEGDSDFDNLNGDLADAANASPAANAGAEIEGFEDNLAAEEFFDNPAPSTANAGLTNAVVPSSEAIDSFKNAPAEEDAFADAGSGASNENLLANPAIASVPSPAAVDAVAAGTAPQPVAPPVSPAAPSRPLGKDVESTPSTLRWVGYRINETMKKLNVEFVTEGPPEYEIFETVNRSNQNELIFRFYHTQLRKKIKWDVNSSEFRSPVAYIRMKNRESEGIVDLVITHRDKIQPGFFEKKGNFILSYDIPERYFSELDLAQKTKLKDKAVSLSSDLASPLAQPKRVASKLPLVGTPRYLTAFREPPKFAPIRNFIAPKRIKNGKDGFPESFDKSSQRGRHTGEIISRRTLLGVAQDNLENNIADEENGDAEEDESGNSSNNALNGNLNNNSGNGNLNGNLNNNSGNGNLNGNLSNNLDSEIENDVGFGDEEAPDAFSDLDNQNSTKTPKADPLPITPAANDSNTSNTSDLEPPATQAGLAEDVEPEEAGGKGAKYSGKPIFMEFYDSPLSLVLKGFQEETGNNFVFPTEVADIPVTIQFRGVPWDEALKAILETYSLGMVRIGENVVRVDRIASLTNYMQALEQATQFESRRVPTKVLVFRLNNGVAKDVATRVAALLARDIELDNRIKLSDDERTNSIVIEAPTTVLAKSKAIIERLDLDTPQVEIMSRIVEVQKNDNDFTGVAWGNNLNFDPGRALGFGTLNFPNSAKSTFSVDPGVAAAPGIAGTGSIRLGSLNKFLDLDLFLKLEEKRSKTNVLQSNRVLVLDGQKASVTAGSSQFFRPAAGGNVINPAPGAGGAGAGGAATGLSEITFNLSLEVTPQVTALGNVIMSLDIASDTPGDTTGEQLASKGTRRIATQMVRASGDTGVIGGIYDTKRNTTVTGVPFLSDLPIIGALFRSTVTKDSQTELLIMVTPTILSGANRAGETAASKAAQSTVISQKNSDKKGSL